MKNKKAIITLLVVFSLAAMFGTSAFAQVYGGGGGGGVAPAPTPTPVETTVSQTATTEADIEANNSIQNNQATVVVNEPTLNRSFSAEFLAASNANLNSITLGNNTAQVTLPQGALNNTAVTEGPTAGRNVTVEVATIPPAQAQQSAGAGITVISAIQVNINVQNADGTSERVSQLGAPVSLQLNVSEYFQGLGIMTEADRAAYIRDNNVMVAFIGPDGAESFYPVTYANGQVSASGITHFSTYSVVEAKNTRVVRMTIDKLNTTINNDARLIDVPPTIKDSRTLVPLRFVGEALGADVEWVAATRTVTVELNGKKLSLVIGQTGPGLDVPAQIIESRTMVPIRYVSEQMGAKVNWNGLTRVVEVIRQK